MDETGMGDGGYVKVYRRGVGVWGRQVREKGQGEE